MDFDNPINKVLTFIIAGVMGVIGITGIVIPITVDQLADLTDKGADYAAWNTSIELVVTVLIFALIIAILYTFVSKTTSKK